METTNALPDYSTTDTTGGQPPHRCFAPTKRGVLQRRLERDLAAAALATEAERARRRAALAASPAALGAAKRRRLYASSATTGNRPPEDCYAPVWRGSAD